MSVLSHFHELFNIHTCHAYIHTLRWQDRPLQCPRCQSQNVGLWVIATTGRGHYDKDRPAIIAWVSRQASVVVQALKDYTVTTVQKAAELAVQVGSRLYTDSASSYWALKGYVHEFVNHTQQEYARGEVHENRAECLFSLLKPYLRVFRGIGKCNLPGYLGFFQFLRNFRQRNAFEQAELILQAALDPAIAGKARRGAFVTYFDPFDLLQTPISG
jgi:transposase